MPVTLFFERNIFCIFVNDSTSFLAPKISAVKTKQKEKNMCRSGHHHDDRYKKLVLFNSKREQFSSVPAYMVEKYVESVYRMNLTFYQCFISLFIVHNETFNIWSSMLAFLYFLFVTAKNNFTTFSHLQ